MPPPGTGSSELPLGSAAPFAGLLLAIALLPVLAPRWWHANRNKALVSLVFGGPVAAWFLWRSPSLVGHAALEYLAFTALLGALFTISGGIRLEGFPSGTPASNAALLGLGAVLANLIGTTGAAMVLIRPLLRANAGRRSRTPHVFFFILIVANSGGCLTPLGDPPLFLGFLRGVPFAWTLGLWREWLAVVGTLLGIFFAWDVVRFRREGAAAAPAGRLRLEGLPNLILLGGVVGAVLAGGLWIRPRWGEEASMAAQAAMMAALAGLSLLWTPREVREANEFVWPPFMEILVLFAGIFAAMIPAVEVLRARGPSLGLSSPAQYFWATGVLSAFLDNAPTYLAFLSVAQHLPDEVAGTTHAVLRAISLGAVFFGAATYIGNGPNFMVRAIAEEAGVRMPSFFGHLAWSAVVLGPVLAGLTLFL